MPRERAARRIRCTGPLCREKKNEKQLHHASEMVTVREGVRLCTDCIKELKLIRQREEDAQYDPLELEPAPEPVSTYEGVIVVRDETPFLPAPTVKFELGDPLMYTPFPNEQVEGWPLRKGRLSASSIGTFVTCPEKFRQKEILGLREPGNGNTIAGGAAHKGVEAYYRYVMSVGAPPRWEVWHEWLNAKFDYEVEHEASRGSVEWGRSSVGEKLPFTADDVRNRAVQVAGTYIDRIAPSVQPVEVEHPFTIWIEGCPVPVVGVKDIVEAETCTDLKFGKAQSRLDPGWRVQGLIYLLDGDRDMTWHSVGWPKVDGSCTFHTPLDAPDLRMPRTYENYSIATDLIRSSVDSIMAYTEKFGVDQPWPGNLGHQYACDMCLFRKNDTCTWWHRNVSAEDIL